MARNQQVNGTPVVPPVSNPVLSAEIAEALKQAGEPRKVSQAEADSEVTADIIDTFEHPTSFLSPAQCGRLMVHSDDSDGIQQRSKRTAPVLYAIASKFRADHGRLTGVNLDIPLDAQTMRDGLTLKVKTESDGSETVLGAAIKMVPQKGEVFKIAVPTTAGKIVVGEWRLKAVEFEYVPAVDDTKQPFFSPLYAIYAHCVENSRIAGSIHRAFALLMGRTYSAPSSK